MFLMSAVKCGGTPYLSSAVIRACGWILSKAFSQSSTMMYSNCPVASALSIRQPMMWIGCEVADDHLYHSHDNSNRRR